MRCTVRRWKEEREMNLNSITDARTFVSNSGVADWEWGGSASADGFAVWLRANRDTVDAADYDDELRAYLRSVGEDPAAYSL